MAAPKRHNRELGYIAEHMNPHVPGTKVVIYRAAEQRLSVGGKKYAVVCDAHGTLVGETSVPRARRAMKAPENFCNACFALRYKDDRDGIENGLTD